MGLCLILDFMGTTPQNHRSVWSFAHNLQGCLAEIQPIDACHSVPLINMETKLEIDHVCLIVPPMEALCGSLRYTSISV